MSDEMHDKTERTPKTEGKASNKDIGPLLRGWDYEPGTINVRKINGAEPSRAGPVRQVRRRGTGPARAGAVSPLYHHDERPRGGVVACGQEAVHRSAVGGGRRLELDQGILRQVRPGRGLHAQQ